MFADYQEFAAAFARQCRERRNAEEEQQRELDELTKPATVSSAADVRKSNGAGAGLVFKTRDDARVVDDSDSGASVERTLPARSAAAKSGSEMAWWEWVDARMEDRLSDYSEEVNKAVGEAIGEIRAQMREHCAREVGIVKRELEQQRRELTVSLREQVLECGRALREEVQTAREQDARERELVIRELSVLREQIGAERELKVREIEQLRCAVDLHAEYQLGVKELRDQVASAQVAQAQAKEDLLQREVAALREQIGLQRELESLRAQVAVAKAEIPQVPAIEARIEAKQSALAAEQKRLEQELAKQKDRLGKLRVNQSVTDFSLKKLEQAQQPAIELKFTTEDGCCFSLKDANPGAVETWRHFARELVQANDGLMSDPTGQVIALPSRGAA